MPVAESQKGERLLYSIRSASRTRTVQQSPINTHTKMEFRCFSSTDPHAVNAYKLYYDHVHEGDLWNRGGQNIPLPPCSNISHLLDGSCLVCLEQKVYAVCRNLMDGVKLVMETRRENVEISESECPKLPSDGLSAGVIAAIVIMSIIFIIIAGLVGYKYWKRSETQNEPNEFNMQTIRPEGTTQVSMEEGGENIIDDG